jgi:prepilin signal peptidase PulO-like enzyme (type II secretory pathway)
MLTQLLIFAPPEAAPLALVVVSFLYMFGFRALATATLVTTLGMLALGPFIDSIVLLLPDWVVAAILVVAIVALFSSLMGRRVRDHVLGNILTDIIRAPFRLLWWFMTRKWIG